VTKRNETVKPDAKKPREIRTPRKERGGGKRPPKTNDPEEKTERYMRATSGSHAHVVSTAMKRTNLLKSLAEPHTAAMIDVMVKIATNEQIHASIRLEAADRVLSRAHGKPKEHIEIEDNSSAATETDEVTKLLNNILAKVGAPLLDAPSEPRTEPSSAPIEPSSE